MLLFYAHPHPTPKEYIENIVIEYEARNTACYIENILNSAQTKFSFVTYVL